MAKHESSSMTTHERGLTISRHYTTPGIDPLDQVEYTTRRSVITNPDGSVVFEMNDVEVPASWSQLATDIIVSKYFRKRGVPGAGHETSARQVVHRIAHTLRQAGESLGGYFAGADDAAAFEAELAYCLIHQHGAFNSPVWFNVGLYHAYGITGSGGNWHWSPFSKTIEETADAYSNPQGSACFIQPVQDDLMSIFDLAKNEARLFKYGSGTGTNFSRLRGRQERLSGGGTSSGLMSFLEVLDRGAGATKSGGTTRRAAKMVSLDMDHPEIADFINWKAREEKKVRALIEAGYPSDFNGEAYRTVSGQNSNNSVRIPDTFMEAYLKGGSWETTMRTTGEVCDTYEARDLMQQIAHAAWMCADPGVQFDTTINTWHTCKTTDRIYGSNPCSEFMFLDNTSCNLASLNLMHFYDPGTGLFDVAAYRHATRIFFIAQEILVDFGSYPTKTIAEKSHNFRPLGLGYANMGTLLMVQGVPYDSDEGRAICAALTAILTGHAYRTSAEMAASKGPFPAYTTNRTAMRDVMVMHRDTAYRIDAAACPTNLLVAAREDWDLALDAGDRHGYRNAQATVLAPTGCLVGGSLIPTERGLVRLESLGNPRGAQWQELQLSVATDQGSQQATKFYVNGVEPVVTVETVRGHRIQGTPTHRIKVVEPSGEWAWRRFAEVEEGDLVPLAMSTLVGVPQPVDLPPPPEVSWTTEHLQIPRRMNGALAELVGYFMGNGSLHAKGLRFCVTAEDTDVVDRLSALAQRLFALSPTMTKQQGYTEVMLSSVSLVLWWEACGFSKHPPHTTESGAPRAHARGTLEEASPEHDTPRTDVRGPTTQRAPRARGGDPTGFARWGGSGDDRVREPAKRVDEEVPAGGAGGYVSPSNSGEGYLAHIPDVILHSNDREIYGAFLRGLYEADGTVTNGIPTWTTVSFDFSRDVQALALALGYPATRRTNITGWGNAPCAVLRLLNISSVARWRDEIGFISRRKTEALQTHDVPQAGHKDHIPVSRILVDRLAPDNTPLRKKLLLALSRNNMVSRDAAEELYQVTKDPELGRLLSFFYDRVAHAELGEEEWTYDLSVPDNVTYIANGFVSHNTIGLLMDCDTTGIEPDFALVKFKKLAGGGYFKIINQSIPLALKRLGYTESEITDIVQHIKGTSTLANAPEINTERLLAKGVSREAIGKIESALPGVFDLRFAFNSFTLGKEEASLESLGFTDAHIERANRHICGTMTIESAPHLKPEHLPVFDCANTCGKEGRRFLQPMSHVKMMAAAQPFISGAISKTINVPHNTTPEEIEALYVESWRLGLKAVALYRDGSKSSQPLSASSEKKKPTTDVQPDAQQPEAPLPMVGPHRLTPVAPWEEASPEHDTPRTDVRGPTAQPHCGAEGEAPAALPLEGATRAPPTVAIADAPRVVRRRRLPKKRLGFTQEARIAGNKIYLRTGEYDDGTLGELFIDMHKEGAAYRSLVNCFAIAVSLGLQHGVPLEEYVDAFTFTRFDPSGPCDHPNIKMVTSAIDYIFRVLGMEYLGRTDFVQIKPEEDTHVEEPRPPQLQGNARKVARTLDKLTGSLQVSPNGAKGGHEPLQTNGQANGKTNGHARPSVPSTAEAHPIVIPSTSQDTGTASGLQTASSGATSVVMSEHLSGMMGDAPFCDQCGNVTVRNGSCYRCLNCGNSMGCS